MTKRLKSKHKVDRRLKVNLWGRPKSPFNKRAYPPGQHGQTKNSKPSDIVQPGHIFPLKAMKGGVLSRAGHTEAACDLAKIAGLQPAGVICEIMNDDGTMARVPDLIPYAKKPPLKIGTIQDPVSYTHLRAHET